MADGTAPRLQRITDYPALLAEAWGQHLAPRDANAPTVISTFAGCGGSSLGYSMAGFRELLAVEWEQNAADTFRLNFPHVPLYHGDIAKLSVEECLRLACVAPGELDVFDGSPPCQGFSTEGKREMGDTRNQLFREFVRLLSGLRPRAFVMENVSGMVEGDFKVIFAEILRTLKACGYRVKVRLLNAMYFGVPQSRERMIFVGVREDLGVEPSHPSGWSEPVGLRVALSCVSRKHMPPMTWAEAFEAVPVGGSVARSCSRELLAKFFPRMINNGSFNFNSYAQRQRWERPSQTIKKSYSDVSPIHPEEHRHYSIDEIKRVASFPDPVVMAGKFVQRWARIGNSVPPLLMRSIARHVRTLVTRG